MSYEYNRDKKEYFSIGRCYSGRHFHRSIEILYCIKKPKRVIIAGKEYTVDEGEGIFVSPCVEHEFPLIEGHTGLVAVLPSYFTDLWEKNTGGRQLVSPIIRDKELARDLYEHLLKLENCKSELLKEGIYYYVLGSVTASTELVEAAGYEDAAFAMRTIEYLEKNYGKNITLTEVSRALGYNRCYFSTLFNRNFHAGFRAYLNRLRIERALRLIGRMPIADIAARVGFESVQVFYRSFRTVMGCTPCEYRDDISFVRRD